MRVFIPRKVNLNWAALLKRQNSVFSEVSELLCSYFAGHWPD